MIQNALIQILRVPVKRYNFSYLSLMRYILILFTILLFSCNRKLHTERTVTNESDTRIVNTDSLNEVIRTYREAYESLFNSQSGTEVTFNCPDTGKVGGSGMPHVIIRPDGTKEFTGVSSFRDNASVTQRISSLREHLIDSMSRLLRTDTSHHEASAVVVVRDVKTSFTPIWVWCLLLLFAALWLNERFGFVKVPLLTRR